MKKLSKDPLLKVKDGSRLFKTTKKLLFVFTKYALTHEELLGEDYCLPG